MDTSFFSSAGCCFLHQLNLLLFTFAGTLCFLSSVVASALNWRARRFSGPVRAIWLISAACVGGLGFWAAQFLLMFAYDIGATLNHSGPLTVLSLAIAAAAVGASTYVDLVLPGRLGSALAILAIAVGIWTTHLLAMITLYFSNTVSWDYHIEIAAYAASTIPLTAAYIAVRCRLRSALGVLGVAAMITLAILTLHLVSLGAVRSIQQPGALAADDMLAYGLTVELMAILALSVLIASVLAIAFASKAENAISASESSLHMIVQGVTDHAIYMLTPKGIVESWNAAAERIKGYKAEEVVGQHFSLFYAAEERDARIPDKALAAALKDGTLQEERWQMRKDGSRFWAHVVIDPIYGGSGQHIGFTKITRDRTEQMQSDARLRDISKSLQLALDHMANGIGVYDASETLVLHNERLRAIMGLPDDVVMLGRTYKELCAESVQGGTEQSGDAEALYERQRVFFTSPSGGEYTRKISNGKTVRTIHRPTGDGSWVTTVEDISELVQSEQQIVHLANHDALTGLLNREGVMGKLDLALASLKEDEYLAAVAIDLDNFKEVNDAFGHAIGDQVLKAVAVRARDSLVAGETAGRLGGDEFIAIKSFREQWALEDFLVRLQVAFTRAVQFDEIEISQSASLGVALCPNDATTGEKLLADAEMAMYRSRANPDEKISFYEASMDENARERRAIARDLPKALLEEQFFLVFQAQHSVTTMGITGYEVLIRWQHPVHGLISPAKFIPIAEECGAISAIGEWVLERACTLAAAAPTPMKIAVNVSALQLGNLSLIDKVRDVLISTKLPPSQLELEVTESAVATDKAKALNILTQIRASGVTIAIDDFGVGFSSLETLRTFPFDKIKLDRSFVSDLETRQSRAFVRAIVALGKSLDVSVLAEGVETEEQLNILRAEGCDQVQGFLFGRPMPFDAMMTER